MNLHSTTSGTRLPSLRALLARGAIALLAVGAGLGSHTAIAAAPPASTQISNQATATYTDSTGATQQAQSNTVVTTIQQVGSFTLVPSDGGATVGLANGNAVNVAPGGTVTVPYTITNTGNGTDTFGIATSATSPGVTATLYADVDQNGLADNSTPITSATIAAGASYSFVVTYAVPTTGGPFSSTVTVTPVGAYGYSPSSMARIDTITITNAAAFQASKALAAPASGVGGAWPVATSGPRGTVATYTITFANNGAAAGNIYIKDVIGTGATSGLTYVAGSAYWSGAPATALTDATGETASGIEYLVTGNTIEAVVANVAPGQTGTLSFKVTVAATAALGTTTTTNAAKYTPTTCAAGTIALCAGSSTADTSAAAFTVVGTYSVIAGIADTVANSGTPSAAAGDDAATFPTSASTKVVAGGSIRYKFTIKNTSSLEPDVFKLSATATGNSTTLTYTWFASDGVTPLQNTTGSSGGAVDTGPVAAGATVDVVLQVTVPGNTPATTTDIVVIPLATSFNDSSKKDAVRATITDVLAVVVDLEDANGAALLGTGAGTNTPLRNIGVTAGGSGVATAALANPAAGSAVFDLVVTNNDSGALAFNLSSSQTASFPGSMPAGWTVTFHASLTDATNNANAITVTSSIAAGGNTHVYARVTPPSTAAAGAQNVFFRALSTTNSSVTGAAVSDFLGDTVQVSAAGSLSFSVSPAAALQVAPGSSAVYSHTVLNTGSSTCGAATATVAGLPTGWTATLYNDLGTLGSLDSADTVIAGPYTAVSIGTLASPGQIPLLVVVTAPSFALPGEVATATLTIATANCVPSVSVADVTNVVSAGQISVVKYQLLNPATANVCGVAGTPSSTAVITGAKPGDCVVYKVVATNISTAVVNNVAINDVVPGYTSYYATQPASQCTATGSTGTIALNPATPITTMQCGTATTLNPGGTITLIYQVQINP